MAASVTPSDVRRYAGESLSDSEVNGYISDAERIVYDVEGLSSADFAAQAEEDLLVTFLAAYLIAGGDDGEKVSSLEQGSRKVTYETAEGVDLDFLESRVRANDPSGEILAESDGVIRDRDRSVFTT